jgi:poly-gamma-glutamate capsule biosynthesis protein CapA/YwtB (metallophosphatase superfamily)
MRAQGGEGVYIYLYWYRMEFEFSDHGSAVDDVSQVLTAESQRHPVVVSVHNDHYGHTKTCRKMFT